MLYSSKHGKIILLFTSYFTTFYTYNPGFSGQKVEYNDIVQDGMIKTFQELIKKVDAIPELRNDVFMAFSNLGCETSPVWFRNQLWYDGLGEYLKK
jgi:hypothetical protein